jgi:hypothetical protein
MKHIDFVLIGHRQRLAKARKQLIFNDISEKNTKRRQTLLQ